jgi:hypothetical protein
MVTVLFLLISKTPIISINLRLLFSDPGYFFFNSQFARFRVFFRSSFLLSDHPENGFQFWLLLIMPIVESTYIINLTVF